jgi:c(7)-type cytochrome triheme protein
MRSALFEISVEMWYAYADIGLLSLWGALESVKKITLIIIYLFFICAAGICLPSDSAFSHGDLALPTLFAPEDYGAVLMEGAVTKAQGVTPVVFSHWVHRTKYTCRVCHGELDFAMKTNETGVVCGKGEAKNSYCTVCHNGKIAFAPKDKAGDNCPRCHNADQSPDTEKFLALKKRLPSAKFGSEIDWVKALDEGLIKPKRSLSEGYQPMELDKTLTLSADMALIPPAVFSHKTHLKWLDCANCHPYIFNIKKKTTKHFSMARSLNGEFCGACHLRIAFPLNDCKGCHPAIKN